MPGTFLEILFPPVDKISASTLEEELAKFSEFGAATKLLQLAAPNTLRRIPIFVNEFWTAKQRDAHSLHEISYRACFKPQLPRFFIERLTAQAEVVYDPFMGRGTTLMEAALMNRVPYGCDVNPLSKLLMKPRLAPPSLASLERRLKEISLDKATGWREDLLAFYHPETLRQIIALKEYLLDRETKGNLDGIDDWIRMVALNRLTGHSPGFFSVYTLPPNQAVSIKSQLKINARRGQTPPPRDVRKIILKKSRALLGDLTHEQELTLHSQGKLSLLLTQASHETAQIPAESVALVVTSPPFLDVVDYAGDNWLRCWFAGIEPGKVAITMAKKLDAWQKVMSEIFLELARVLTPGGHVAFEVGEVRGGTVRLEETVVPCGIAAGLDPRLILINAQEFTKTANCWGVDNNDKGTNSNRIVLFQKPLR